MFVCLLASSDFDSDVTHSKAQDILNSKIHLLCLMEQHVLFDGTLIRSIGKLYLSKILCDKYASRQGKHCFIIIVD